MTPWFRRKKFGLGWTPAGWQGWLATLLFVLVCFGISDPELTHLDKSGQAVCLVALIICFLAVVLATSAREAED